MAVCFNKPRHEHVGTTVYTLCIILLAVRLCSSTMATLKQNLACLFMLMVIVLCIISINQMLITQSSRVVSETMKRPLKEIGDIPEAMLEGDEFDLNGPDTSMDDPRVISRLRDEFLYKPPPSNVKLNLSKPKVPDTSMGQSKIIRQILNNKRDGFYIECGALDGETRSNSLVFERELGWSGLLIEADPKNFKMVVQKRRQAYLSPTCLSTKPYPIKVSFHQAFNIGKIASPPPGNNNKNYVDVQCFPLYSYLLALNRTTIDYFSLDVEGNELEVLENIPFDKVDIRTLSVEFIHGVRGKNTLRTFMEGKGYLLWGEVTHPQGLANDYIFYKKVSET